MVLQDNVTLTKDKRTGLWVAVKGSKINTADNIQDAIAVFYNKRVR
jgi:hypothetical protein